MFQLDDVKVQLLFFATCSLWYYCIVEVFLYQSEVFLQRKMGFKNKGQLF
jgi:hypothetical protein